ncbi:MAG TPA: response regulator [Smithellaceae bacterium]|nr:response regulator [Smithellaceae bacterium]HRS88075.1 response regulator [Smithellaceae bacterium]HRV25450.1 response regulator [Smithellaceae bacterium]
MTPEQLEKTGTLLLNGLTPVLKREFPEAFETTPKPKEESRVPSTSQDSTMTDSQKNSNKYVLLVDDEESFLDSLSEELSDELSLYHKYFQIRTASNGAEAVKVLKLHPIDLVITDLSMPKMDGFELLAYIKRNYPTIPVVLMTAIRAPKIKKICEDMGVFRYLEKPLDVGDIAEVIIDALKENATSQEYSTPKKTLFNRIYTAFLKWPQTSEGAFFLMGFILAYYIFLIFKHDEYVFPFTLIVNVIIAFLTLYFFALAVTAFKRPSMRKEKEEKE